MRAEHLARALHLRGSVGRSLGRGHRLRGDDFLSFLTGHPAVSFCFVDDGSRDRSWDVLREIQAEHSDRVICLQLMRNFGQHNALMCGFRHTQGQFVVTLDDDLQNPPEEIGKLLEAIRSQKLDVVYGAPDRRKPAAARPVPSPPG